MFGIVAVIIMVAAYVGLVGAYFAFAAPVITSIVALYVAGDLIAGYFPGYGSGHPARADSN